MRIKMRTKGFWKHQTVAFLTLFSWTLTMNCNPVGSRDVCHKHISCFELNECNFTEIPSVDSPLLKRKLKTWNVKIWDASCYPVICGQCEAKSPSTWKCVHLNPRQLLFLFLLLDSQGLVDQASLQAQEPAQFIRAGQISTVKIY